MKHELKILPQYYCRVADGSKTFEVRKNDRGFQPGDTVILKEWGTTYVQSMPGGSASYYNPHTGTMGPPPMEEVGCYTKSPVLTFKIGYVLPIDAERVVFSLLKESS